MITSSLLYLLIIGTISAFFGYLKQKSSFKVFSSHLYVAALIFFLTYTLSQFGFFAHTQGIYELQKKIISNLLPAMLFLIFIDLDIKHLFRASEIGCSCTIGPKRYWFLLILSFFVSLVSQFIGLHVEFLVPFLSAALIASLVGVAFSFTKLKEVNGIRDIATTMLYLLVAVIGTSA